MLEINIFKVYWWLLKCIHAVAIYRVPHIPNEV